MPLDPSALSPETCRVERVFRLRVELGPLDRAEDMREAVLSVTSLTWGDYDQVSFETETGHQHYRTGPDAAGGPLPPETVPARALSFSIPPETAVLDRVLDAIQHAHSYEEPVIYVTESLATRARPEITRSSPWKKWHRADG